LNRSVFLLIPQKFTFLLSVASPNRFRAQTIAADKTADTLTSGISLRHPLCKSEVFESKAIYQWFLTEASRNFQGSRAITCSTTWKVFERECVLSKRGFLHCGRTPA